MKTLVGLWIDHRKAFIVMETDKGEKTKLIKSNVERQLRRARGVVSNAAYDPQQVPADDSQEREFMEHINVYYDEVIACIHDAEFILILGPGEAKGELKKRIEKKKLPGRIVGVETVHKMTDRQIVAKVRKHFQEMELCQLSELSGKCS